jgi:hypothetical protein
VGVNGTARWQEHTLESEALRGNPLGDPHERPVFVWTPPSYDAEHDARERGHCQSPPHGRRR